MSDPAADDPVVTPQDLVRWSEALAGVARTGLGFTESLYERERFEEVLAVAADMRVAAGSAYDADAARARVDELGRPRGARLPDPQGRRGCRGRQRRR